MSNAKDRANDLLNRLGFTPTEEQFSMVEEAMQDEPDALRWRGLVGMLADHDAEVCEPEVYEEHTGKLRARVRELEKALESQASATADTREPSTPPEEPPQGTRIYGSRRSGTWTEEDRMAVISGVACLRTAGLRADADRLDAIEHRMAGGARDLTAPLADAVVAMRTNLDTWDRHDPNRPDVEPPPGTQWVYCYKPATGPAQEPGWRWEAIDDGLVDLVKQLQLAPAGHRPLVPTTGCCAGHREGERPHVLLADGRVLVVFDSLDEAERKTTEEPSRFASTIVSTVVSMRKAAEVEAQEAYDAGRAIANKVTEKWEEWALDIASADPISDWDALRRDIRLLVDYALERGVRPDGKGGLVEDPAGAHALRDLGSNPAFESYDPEAHLEDLAAERSDVAPLKLDPPYRPSTLIVFLAGHVGDVVLDAGGLFRLLAGSADTIARLSTERWKERSPPPTRPSSGSP